MDFEALLPVLALAIALFGAMVGAMAIGVIFRRPCLRGSCGGVAARGPDGKALSCATCPNRRK